MAEEKKIMTTDAGRPVGDNQNSLTVGPRGPVVFEDFLLFEKMAHFNRERIPERVVHAKGSGRARTFCLHEFGDHQVHDSKAIQYCGQRARRRPSASPLWAEKKVRRTRRATRAASH